MANTILTWCENCDADMHLEGGDSCMECDKELCMDCLSEDPDGDYYCEDCIK